MDAQQVRIDEKLCNNCGVCIDVCPNEAIAFVAGTTPIIHIPTPNPEKNPIMPIQPLSEQVEISAPLKEIKPLTRVAMAFLESEIAPHLVTMAVSVLERRLTRTVSTTFKPEATNPLQNHTTKTRMKRMRIRSRGRSGM